MSSLNNTSSSSVPDPDSMEQCDNAGDMETASVSFASMPWLREDIEDAPFWKEVTAFNRLPQSMIDEHYGRYVAVYQGNIVDSDTDEGELALRFYRTFGYVPVYIHKVGTEEGLVETED
jgi:hypothetical protein